MTNEDDGAADEVSTSADITGGIVVGHDGSGAAGDAVRWAADLAHRLGEPLHVVRAWSLARAPKPKSLEGGFIPPQADWEAAVCEALQADLAALALPADVRGAAFARTGGGKLYVLWARTGADESATASYALRADREVRVRTWAPGAGERMETRAPAGGVVTLALTGTPTVVEVP